MSHPHLFDDVVYVDEPTWIAGAPENFIKDAIFRCQYKYQHIFKAQNCGIERVDFEVEPVDNYFDVRLHAQDANGSHHNTPLTPDMLQRRRAHLRTIQQSVRYKVTLDAAQRSLTQGQYLVFYDGNECLGSAKIITLGQTMYEKNSNDFKAKPDLEMRIT